MRSRLNLWGLLLVALLVIAPRIAAQFTIQSSNPTNGSLIQPGALDLCLTFSAPLDTTQRWPVNGSEEALAPAAVTIAEPEEALGYGGWSWDGANNRLCFSLWLEDEVDFIFLVSMARDTQGHDLAAPFELHLSTAGAWGPRSVSGTLTRADGGSVAGGLVALFDVFPFGSDNARLSAGTVAPLADGAYTIPYVREGWYFPVSAMDLNQDGFIDPSMGDLFGYYDGNGDGLPDSVLVAGSNLTGINMSLDVMGQVRARDALSAAYSAAAAAAPDAQLQAVVSAGESVDFEGRCFGWLYHFYAPQSGLFVDVFHNGTISQVSVADSSDWPLMAGLYPLFMDSDAALNIALDAGGADFQSGLVTVYRNMQCGNFFWAWPPEPDAFLWLVDFWGFDADNNWQDFLVILDAVSGEVYFTSNDGLPDPGMTPRPSDFSLGAPWPNPFNPAVHIPYELTRAGELRLAVYNLAGQLMAEPVHGPQAAGRHEALLRAEGWPSGLYLVTLEMAGHRESRKIALLR
jgi:hypothetical protein